MKKTKEKKRVRNKPLCTTCGYPHSRRLTCLQAWLRSSSSMEPKGNKDNVGNSAA